MEDTQFETDLCVQLGDVTMILCDDVPHKCNTVAQPLRTLVYVVLTNDTVMDLIFRTGYFFTTDI